MLFFTYIDFLYCSIFFSFWDKHTILIFFYLLCTLKKFWIRKWSIIREMIWLPLANEVRRKILEEYIRGKGDDITFFFRFCEQFNFFWKWSLIREIKFSRYIYFFFPLMKDYFSRDFSILRDTYILTSYLSHVENLTSKNLSRLEQLVLLSKRSSPRKHVSAEKVKRESRFGKLKRCLSASTPSN